VSAGGHSETIAGVGNDGQPGLSRGDVLLKGALAAGALYGLNAVSPFVHRVLAAEPKNDVEVLNYLLPFEYLQVSLYNRVLTEVNDKGEKMPLKSKQKAMIEELFDQEAEHVAALTEMIEKAGGKPVKKGNYAFAFRIFEEVLTISASIEGTTVGAFNGAIALLKSPQARELSYSMLQVDARHAASALSGLGEAPAPYSFDHCVPEQDSILHMVPYTGVYPDFEEG
jgi:rubrerythrin